MLATMAIIGGVDCRPRLGGVVKLEDQGFGTISRITPRGRIYIQLNDGGVSVNRLNAMVPVCTHVNVYKLLFRKTILRY